MHIAGKHAFVTGAGKRLGRAMSEALLDHGATLSAHFRNSREEVLSLSAQFPGRVFPVAADLTQVGEIRSAVAEAIDHFGPIDILINSASDFYPTPLFNVTEEQWDHLLSLNLKGQFFTAQAVAQSMGSRTGVILNLADVNGERPMRNFTPYVISKAGLLMMTRNLAKELAPRIRVNSISPGAVLLPESYSQEQRQRAIDKSLLKRLGSPADIVEAALFLIASDYVTGFDLKVDGGRSLAD